MKTITGLLVDATQEKITVETVEPTLSSYYKLLHCDLIDIISRRIGDRQFVIVCDDEGLLKDSPVITAIDCLGHPMLVGNLFIVNDGEDGELRSLTTEDILFISGYTRMLPDLKKCSLRPVVSCVEYF